MRDVIYTLITLIIILHYYMRMILPLFLFSPGWNSFSLQNTPYSDLSSATMVVSSSMLQSFWSNSISSMVAPRPQMSAFRSGFFSDKNTCGIQGATEKNYIYLLDLQTNVFRHFITRDIFSRPMQRWARAQGAVWTFPELGIWGLRFFG